MNLLDVGRVAGLIEIQHIGDWMRIRVIKRYVFVVLVALVLVGCSPGTRLPSKSPVPVKTVTPPVVEPPTAIVPMLPKIQPLDWQASIRPLVASMLNTEEINTGGVLLLGSVKNNTNGSLQMRSATTALHDVLTANKKFTVVSPKQFAVAKQTLGLSEDDSLVSRSKAVGLARYVGAQYVLYSAVSGDVKAPEIAMQLMLVQSGEIIWSGSDTIKR